MIDYAGKTALVTGGASGIGRALAEGIWSCAAINIRDFATDKHHTVDDTPAGGGAATMTAPARRPATRS